MGRPLPGYEVVLVDPATGEPADEGEICLDLSQRPLGLMVGYRDDDERTSEAMSGGYYHTGDVASRDADGYITYVGRTDDVFKASDYRISPFELESVLIEHEAVAEAAVVPSPDPLRLAVPKAFVVLAAGFEPTATPRSRSCATRASTSRPTSGSAGSSSPSCRRRSAARSAASSCARNEEQRSIRRVLRSGLSGAALLGLFAAAPAWADVLLYRCGPDVCRAAPDGTGRKALTRDVDWLSASSDGTRLAVVRDTFAYVLDASGRQVGEALPRGGTDGDRRDGARRPPGRDGRVAAGDQPGAGRQPAGQSRASRASCRTCS